MNNMRSTYTAVALSTVLSIFSNNIFAAQPKTIQFIEDIVAGQDIFSHYVVHCSDGVKHDVSAWNNRQLWCVGKGKKDKCNKTQISIARYVCKATG